MEVAKTQKKFIAVITEKEKIKEKLESYTKNLTLLTLKLHLGQTIIMELESKSRNRSLKEASVETISGERLAGFYFQGDKEGIRISFSADDVVQIGIRVEAESNGQPLRLEETELIVKK